MLDRHVLDDLTTHMLGELAPEASRRTAEHLIGCPECRAAYDDVRFVSSLLGSLPTVEPRDDLWESIEAAKGSAPASIGLSQPIGLGRLDARPRFAGWTRYAAAAAFVLVALGGLSVWLATRSARPSYRVTTLTGSPRVGSSLFGSSDQLGLGDELVTDQTSRAEIRVGAIGTVDVDPNSCVRLVTANMTEHRLALDRGTISARISAPPRLFFVDTPSAVAVDYGCAYTLTVDDAGASLLRVTLGAVSLELNGRDSLVPMGAACATRPGRGPGTPYFEDASEQLRAALARYDFENGGSRALADVLDSARARDSLTLWYLLARSDGSDRALVYDRLAVLAPPPEGVARDAVLALDAPALDRWRSRIESNW